MAIEIAKVPHSENTGNMPKVIYNITDEDFEFYHDRANNPNPYVIPANSEVMFPEYLAYFGAKKLAEKIVYGAANEKHMAKVKELRDAGSVQPPESAGGIAIHIKEIKDTMDVILAGKPKDAVAETIPAITEDTQNEEEGTEKNNKTEETEETTEEQTDYTKMKWHKLRRLAVEKGIFKSTMKKADIIKALSS